MNILFFDTETNGKPLRYKASMAEVDNWPRVIQLAWQIADDSNRVITSVSQLIKPDGWTIPVEQFWIDNGYSTEKNEAEGFPLYAVLDVFIRDILQYNINIIIAHNIAFDINVLGAEMIRYNKKPDRKLTQICTMHRGTDLCQLPGAYGFKWPKLEELHQHLFNKGFEGAHDAGNDVAACRDCFFEMVKRGLIVLPVLT